MSIDLILTRLSRTRANALRTVAAGHGAHVHGRELSGLRAWGLIHITDHTVTAKGHEVLAQLEEGAA